MAIVVNVVLLFFLLLFVAQGFEIFNKLHVKEMDAVSGQFDNFAGVYQGMGDLDKGGNQNQQSYNSGGGGSGNRSGLIGGGPGQGQNMT